MTRLDHVRLARSKVLFCPIFVDNMHRPRLHDAYVSDLAAVGADHRLSAFGPLPTRPQRQASDGCVADPDEFSAGLIRSRRLIRGIEVQLLDAGPISLSSNRRSKRLRCGGLRRSLVEEDAVSLVSDARLADVVLARSVGAVDRVSAVISRGEADRYIAVHVMAGEVKRVVMDLLPDPDA